VTVALSLATIEGFAHWWEALAPQASIPDPGDSNQAFQTELRHRRAATMDLPLVQEDTRGWALEPGAQLCHTGDLPVRVNSLGFRGPELGEPEPGELRLMPLGDSSCFGFAVAEADTLGAVAAERLTEALGRPVREVNACVPGYDSAKAQMSLEHLQPHVLPAWVVVTAMWSDVFRRREGILPRDVVQTGREGLGHLASYRQLKRALTPLLRPRQVRWILDRDDLRTYAANLARIASDASAQGARSLFLALPAPVDFDLVPPPETISLYREAMAHVAAEAEAPFVDGPAWFRAHGADDSFFVDQVHPDTRGHALLGEAVAEAIAAEPAPPPEAHHYGPPGLTPVLAPAPAHSGPEELGSCDVVKEAGVIPERGSRP
jgi:lysophospholipase L1-like esterase